MKYYCGPMWFPKFLTKYLSSDYGVNIACKIHDNDYIEQKFSKTCIDNMFRVNLINSGAGKIRAYGFYYSVRVIGFISWYYIKWSK